MSNLKEIGDIISSLSRKLINKYAIEKLYAVVKITKLLM